MVPMATVLDHMPSEVASTTTYVVGWGVRILALLPALAVSGGVALAAMDGASASRMIFNAIVLLGLWAGVVHVFLLRTQVRGETLRIRRGRTISVNLAEVRMARRDGAGTSLTMHDASVVFIPMFLPGVTGDQPVAIDGPAVAEALRGRSGRHPARDLRRIIERSHEKHRS